MTKAEYLEAVKGELGFMPYDEVVKALECIEMLFHGEKSDEEVIRELGDPKKVAEEYIKVYRPKNTKEKSTGNKWTTIWIWIVAIIVLSPIILPICFAVAICVILLLFVVVMFFPALFVGGIVTWLGSVVYIFKSIFMSYTISDMIMQIGIGCIMFGAGLLVSLGSVYIMVKIIPWIIRKIVDRGSKIVNGG